MARQTVEAPEERKQYIVPTGKPIQVNVTAIEFVEKDNSDNKYVKVSIESIPQGDEDSRIASFILNYPFVDDSKHTSNNIANYSVLFSSLSDKDLETYFAPGGLTKEGGYSDDYKEFYDDFMGTLAPNWQSIPCNIMLGYPINKSGKINEYPGINKYGRYINSAKRPKDLTDFNPKYLSLEKGVKEDEPEVRTTASKGNQKAIGSNKDF